MTAPAQTTPTETLRAVLGLDSDVFKVFEHFITTEITPEMEQVRRLRRGSVHDYLERIARCARHISDTVEPVLIPMLGKCRVLMVRRELYLNRVGKDLGVKWKETEMFKRYIGLVEPSDHRQEHADAKRMKSIPEHIDLEPATSVITSTSEPASPIRSLPMDEAQVDPLSDETTDPDSESSNNTPTYSFSGQERSGRLKVDIHMSSEVMAEATRSGFGCTGYTPEQIIALLVQVEYIPEAELRGTGLETPNIDHGREEVGSVKPISSAIIKILQAGIVNAVWKSVTVYAMSQKRDRDRDRSTAGQTLGSGSRPIYSMLFLNGRFMRLVIRDQVVRIEFSSDECGNRETDRNEVREAETTLTSTSTLDERGTMSGLLTRMNMKGGCRSLLRHHIITDDGMKRFWKWCGAAVWSFVPIESDSDSDRVRSNSTSTSTAVRSPMRTGRKTAREEAIGSGFICTPTPTVTSNGVRKRGRTKSVAAMNKDDDGNEERDEDGDDDGGRGNRGKRTKVLVVREQDGAGEDDNDDHHEDDDGGDEQGDAENPSSRTRAGGQQQDEETVSRDVETKSKAGIEIDNWRTAIGTKTTAEASETETRYTEENPRPQSPTPSDDLEVGAGDHAMDSEEYMEYVDMPEKMRILDELGWRIEYCSSSGIELFADTMRL
jgi:hypothetical protein